MSTPANIGPDPVFPGEGPERNVISDARDEIVTVLRTVDTLGGRIYVEPGQPPQPPCVFVPAAELSFEAYSASPSGVAFLLDVVVRHNRHAADHLHALVLELSNAFAVSGIAVVTEATPADYRADDGADLPAYQVRVEADLP